MVRALQSASAALLLCLVLGRTAGAEDARALPPIGFDENGRADALASELAAPDLKGVPIAVRLDVDSGGGTRADIDAARARVSTLAGAGLQVWVRLTHLPSAGDETAVRQWRGFVRALLDRTRGQVRLVELPLASASVQAAAAERAFLLKVAAVQVRAWIRQR